MVVWATSLQVATAERCTPEWSSTGTQSGAVASRHSATRQADCVELRHAGSPSPPIARKKRTNQRRARPHSVLLHDTLQRALAAQLLQRRAQLVHGGIGGLLVERQIKITATEGQHHTEVLITLLTCQVLASDG